MKRSVKSNQREVVEFNVIANAAGTALTGLDALKVTLTDTGTGDKLLTLPEALNDMSVTVSSATTGVVAELGTLTTTTVQILTFDTATGASPTDGIVHVRIVGSLIADRY